MVYKNPLLFSFTPSLSVIDVTKHIFICYATINVDFKLLKYMFDFHIL